MRGEPVVRGLRLDYTGRAGARSIVCARIHKLTLDKAKATESLTNQRRSSDLRIWHGVC